MSVTFLTFKCLLPLLNILSAGVQTLGDPAPVVLPPNVWKWPRLRCIAEQSGVAVPAEGHLHRL